MCTTNGGTTDERRSTIDPLTATAPEAGNASPTSRSRRTWSAGARGAQPPVPVPQPIAAPQDGVGAVVARHDPPAPVQLENADPRVIEQGDHGRVPHLGGDQRLPDADELSDMGQQPLDHRDLRRSPAIRGHGIAETPGDVGAVRTIPAHVQAILVFGPEHYLVVGW